MKFDCSYRVIEFNNGSKKLLIDFTEKKYEVLSFFLWNEAYSKKSAQWTINALDKVLSGEVDYEEVYGNAFSIKVTLSKTEIYYYYAIEGIEDSCEVDTKELRELIDLWCDKVREFNEKYNKDFI